MLGQRGLSLKSSRSTYTAGTLGVEESHDQLRRIHVGRKAAFRPWGAEVEIPSLGHQSVIRGGGQHRLHRIVES
jgi:hypothetical protein